MDNEIDYANNTIAAGNTIILFAGLWFFMPWAYAAAIAGCVYLIVLFLLAD